jgi:hypothetical protein
MYLHPTTDCGPDASADAPTTDRCPDVGPDSGPYAGTYACTYAGTYAGPYASTYVSPHASPDTDNVFRRGYHKYLRSVVWGDLWRHGKRDGLRSGFLVCVVTTRVGQYNTG